MSMHSTPSRTAPQLIPVLSPAAFTYNGVKPKVEEKEKSFTSNNLEHANDMLTEANNIIHDQEMRIAQLEKMLQTDELTNLMNRRSFMCAVNRELACLRRQKDGSALLVLIDVDQFSNINAKHGRSIGDAYLQTLASVLLNEVRSVDSVARLENDRFAILFTQIDTKDAGARLKHLEETLHNRVMHHNNHSVPISASFGYSIVKETETVDGLLLAADMKLYGNKARKRMRG